MQALPFRFGAVPAADGTTTDFRLWAPSQRQVVLETDDGQRFDLEPKPGGWFEATLPLSAGSRYRYAVVQADGAPLSVPDPASRGQAGDVHDFSIVVDPSAFEWQHPDWRGRPWHEAVVYELHAGLMGGFEGIEAKLEELKALGVTAIELMPIADFPGPRNWGYDGVLPYAPDASYGTPAELQHLVDAAHGLGLMVMLDVVYNHFGPDGNYLPLLAPAFYRDDVKTPWGSAIDFRRPEVRDYFTANAVQWIRDYRIDGLRLDAVHEIGEGDWLDEMALAVREAAGPDRHVHLVLENENNDAAHLEPEPHRFDAQWNDDLHHAVHVLLTGETEGYYQDHADRPAERLARILDSGFGYQGEPSKNWKGEPRGMPSGHLPTTAFIDCLQNHDQIGNRALGDRLVTLAEPKAVQAAVALLLMSPHIPMIFMGEEDGSRTPFLFFTSHHDELADLVREGRRSEFAHFAAFADPGLRERIPDPNAPATFESSRPQPGPDADTWRALYRGLLRLRAERLVPVLPGTRGAGARALGAKAVEASWTLGDGSRLVVASHFGDTPLAWSGAPAGGERVWSSAGEDTPSNADAAALPPHSTQVWIVPAA